MDSLRVGGSDADRVQGLCERVDLLLDLNRPQEALPLVAQALTLDPSSITAHCNQARVWKALGDFRAALKASETAIALDPQEEWGHRLRALILLDQGNGEEALTAALEAVHLDPERFQVLQCVVQCANANRRYPLARIWAERGRDLYPGNATFHGWLGTVAIHEGNWSEAETHLRRSLEIDPTYHAHAFNLGLVLKTQGRERAAIASFYQAAQLTPTDSSSQEQLYGLISKAAEPARQVALWFGFSIALFAAPALGRVGWWAWVVGLMVGAAGYFAWERWWLTTLSGSIRDFYWRRRKWDLLEKVRDQGSFAWRYVRVVLVIWLCLAIVWIPLALVRLKSGDWRTPLALLGITVLAWRILKWAPAAFESKAHSQRAAALELPENTRDAPAPLVPLRVVAFASQLQVDAVLGPPSTVFPILTLPELMPGEYREYPLAGQGVVLVRFFCGQAISFNVRTESGQAKSSAAALQIFFGIGTTGLTTWRGTASEHAWVGLTEGLSFSRLWVGHKGRLGGGKSTIACFNAAEALIQVSSRKN